MTVRREQTEQLAIRFGRNLFRLRRRARLSQEEVAVRAAVHRTEIGLLENGRRVPRLDTIVKLIGALQVEPGVLLAGMDWTPSAPKEGHFHIVGEDLPSWREQDDGEGAA